MEKTDGPVKELMRTIDCVNVAKLNARFLVEKQLPEPTEQDLRTHLYFICSVFPALMARGTNGDEIVSREKVLVAWDPARLQGNDASQLKVQTWLASIQRKPGRVTILDKEHQTG
jgi:hypothetical protein